MINAHQDNNLRNELIEKSAFLSSLIQDGLRQRSFDDSLNYKTVVFAGHANVSGVLFG